MDAAGPHRKRLQRREVESGVRFVTRSCQHRLPLFKNPQIAEVFVDAVRRAQASHQLQVFAWVVMPEHVHMLCRTGGGHTLANALWSINLSVTTRTLRRWKKLNAHILSRLHDESGRPRFWLKGGGFDRNTRDEGELCRTIRYIHRNPVERGLVQRPEDWQFSSVHWWMNRVPAPLECQPPPLPGWELWKGYR